MRRFPLRFLTAALLAFGLSQALFSEQASAQDDKPLRVGIIGLDTSHAIAFTREFNKEPASDEMRNCRVVAAYPQGSLDIPSSVERIPKYTEDIQKLGVEIVDSIDELLERVDCVLLETNDGRRHLEQALPVFKAGKPVFIDKPIAASLSDAIAIVRAAEHYKVPMFSASSLRYTDGAQAIRSGSLGRVMGCDAYSPASLEETHGDLFWYGIHGVETLFTCMGTGVQSVSRTTSDDMDVVVGLWDEGRIGTFRGIRGGAKGYGGTAFGSEKIGQIGSYAGYRPLVVEIAKFFQTGEIPIDPRETIEICAFMEAADESKRQGGAPVSIAEVMKKAEAEADKALEGVLE
ncbi:Gfo/Idh/MocA family protein [Candidatus Laterigemmans baculatus]|uniref:Gfo/Idh/MocA family protein n=1 Tax=Candidatus Laterigemmans baculatus TaxID=2770505 RepID=UPI0013DD1E4F|nr:Gfo/Idh/MocA family oxidoreductase [Candidatus Laterigemmans baculatus]